MIVDGWIGDHEEQDRDRTGVVAMAVLLACALVYRYRVGHRLNVEGHAAWEIEKAKRR